MRPVRPLPVLVGALAVAAALALLLPLPAGSRALPASTARAAAPVVPAPEPAPVVSAGTDVPVDEASPRWTAVPAPRPAPPAATTPAQRPGERRADRSSEQRGSGSAPVPTRAPAAPAPAPPPAPGPAPAAPHAVADGAFAARVHELVNAERVRAGLAPLAVSSCATPSAVAWSERMAAAGALSHGDVGALLGRCGGSRAAENVAHGDVGPERLVAMWMASPGHRANVLDPALTSVGTGVVVVGGHVWATQQLLG